MACFSINSFTHQAKSTAVESFCGVGKNTAEGRARTFVIETVDAVDGGRLVIAPEQEEVLGVFDLIAQQQADGLQPDVSPPGTSGLASGRSRAFCVVPCRVGVVSCHVVSFVPPVSS